MNPLSTEFRPWLKKSTDSNSNKHGHNAPLLGLPRDVAFAEPLLGNTSHMTAPISIPNAATRLGFPANNYISQIANTDSFRGQGISHIGFIPSHDGFGYQMHSVSNNDKVSFVNDTQEFFRNSETKAGIEPPSSPWHDDLCNKPGILRSQPERPVNSACLLTEQQVFDNVKKQTKLDFTPQQEPDQTLTTADYPCTISDAGKSVLVNKTLASFSSPSPWTWGQHDRIVVKSSANEAQVTTENWMPVKRAINQPSPSSNLLNLIDENNEEEKKEDEKEAFFSNMITATAENEQSRIYRVIVDGTPYDLKSGMVADQFGMFSLLYLIKSNKNNPGGALLMDGLSRDDFPLHKSDRIFDAFCNPWSSISRRPQDIDRNLPNEYLTNAYIKQKLPPIKLSRYNEDLLFYLFYIYCEDTIQVAAAYELYQREWRYHKTEQVWLERIPGISPVTITDSWEQGTYFYFDVVTWRKHPKQFRIEYSQLEEKPIFFSN
ncbi:CNOT2 [Acanthosepion pharaonis]|uniref:CNOT2 n=1 Tax=Acanthosepion pharaonis TaxID=158019 RepID=A0A812D835_ACAPH|nr:CNOT2 [Sepia pharaonis]